LSYSTTKDRLLKLLEPPVQALGFELVDIDARTGGGGFLRVYIDQKTGVNLDDCELVSRQISAVLDVEDPIPGHYVLEVSSPGLDRPLRTREHFEQFCDHMVNVKLQHALDGRRKFAGRLLSVDDQNIAVQIEDEVFSLEFVNIASAQLVIEH
jgi:ribosome maturation factor RimP